MKLLDARLCADCDEVFNGTKHRDCPSCTCRHSFSYPLSRWVPTLKIDQEPESEPRAAIVDSPG